MMIHLRNNGNLDRGNREEGSSDNEARRAKSENQSFEA
jgi:hypothetical protein